MFMIALLPRMKTEERDVYKRQILSCKLETLAEKVTCEQNDSDYRIFRKLPDQVLPDGQDEQS